MIIIRKLESLRKDNQLVYLMILVFTISNVSYYPYFLHFPFVRTIAIFAWAFICIYTLIHFQKTYLPKELYIMLVLYFFFLAHNVLIYFTKSKDVFNNHFFFNIFISIVILFISVQLGFNLSFEDYKKLIYAYTHSITICSIPLFFFYCRGMDLSLVYYEYDWKNELAIMLLCALILLVTFYETKTIWGKAYRLIGAGFLLTDMIYLRCRSSFLGVLLLFITVIIYRDINRNIKRFACVFAFALIVYFANNTENYRYFINNIVYASQDANSLDSISSGRLTQVNEAWNVFLQNMMLGVGKRRTTDFFYVSALANYGILSWPILLMPFMPVIWGLYNNRRRTKPKKNDSKYIKEDVQYISFPKEEYKTISFVIISISLFIVSFFEELAPFGSGVRCYILWFMWGMLIGSKGKYEDKTNKFKVMDNETNGRA